MSRAGLQQKADILVEDSTDLSPSRFKNVHCVLVDEAQFLSTTVIEKLRIVANSGVPVICYGLRTDFRSNLFEGSRRLMELADSIEEVKTTCFFCNKKATFNLKLVDGKGTLSGAQVELGCEEKYVPVCNTCFFKHTAADRDASDILAKFEMDECAAHAMAVHAVEQPELLN